MFEIFLRTFVADPEPAARSTAVSDPDPWLAELTRRFGGRSFERGLYRVIDAGGRDTWVARIEAAFPELAPRMLPFGYDWLGRLFALDRDRSEDGHAAVALLEPGTAEMLEIPCNLHTFHERELIEYRNEALAAEFHGRWLHNGGKTPAYDECIGYKRPLFLGGEDELGNLAPSPIEVYWELSAQLIRKTRGLLPGTRIGKITID